VKITVHW